jgi:type I restriction enzyme M protein
VSTSTLIEKLWNCCNVLRDDGMTYSDHVERLTYLLFLKMADERSRPPYNQPNPIPAAYAWPALPAKDGDALFDLYRHTLEVLGKQPGTLALIFRKAQNKFYSHRLRAMLTLRAPFGRPISGGNCQDPAKLRRVIVAPVAPGTWRG